MYSTVKVESKAGMRRSIAMLPRSIVGNFMPGLIKLIEDAVPGMEVVPMGFFGSNLYAGIRGARIGAAQILGERWDRQAGGRRQDVKAAHARVAVGVGDPHPGISAKVRADSSADLCHALLIKAVVKRKARLGRRRAVHRAGIGDAEGALERDVFWRSNRTADHVDADTDGNRQAGEWRPLHLAEVTGAVEFADISHRKAGLDDGASKPEGVVVLEIQERIIVKIAIRPGGRD